MQAKVNLQILLTSIILFMSSQLGGSVIIPGSYNPRRQDNNNYRSRTIESNGFSKWAADHMYKSSYAHFHSKDSTNPKTSVIPGYQGFIPQNRSESLHAKGYTSMTKQVLGTSNYGKNFTGLASNGFNVTKQNFVDQSKVGSASKYGRSSWLKAHPAWQSNQWKTTTQQTFIDPKARVVPTYRQSSKQEQYRKQPAMSSGFSTNRAYWDGTGWNPERVLNAQNIGSQYRNIFNPQKPLHRDANISKVRQMRKPEANYKFNF